MPPAASPATQRPGMTLPVLSMHSASTVHSKPPMQQWITGVIMATLIERMRTKNPRVEIKQNNSCTENVYLSSYQGKYVTRWIEGVAYNSSHMSQQPCYAQETQNGSVATLDPSSASPGCCNLKHSARSASVSEAVNSHLLMNKRRNTRDQK